jgi:hypothetical protein
MHIVGYWCLLMAIGGYFIDGYECYYISGYWWLFYWWLLMTINGYFINGY